MWTLENESLRIIQIRVFRQNSPVIPFLWNPRRPFQESLDEDPIIFQYLTTTTVTTTNHHHHSNHRLPITMFRKYPPLPTMTLLHSVPTKALPISPTTIGTLPRKPLRAFCHYQNRASLIIITSFCRSHRIGAMSDKASFSRNDGGRGRHNSPT